MSTKPKQRSAEPPRYLSASLPFNLAEATFPSPSPPPSPRDAGQTVTSGEHHSAAATTTGSYQTRPTRVSFLHTISTSLLLIYVQFSVNSDVTGGLQCCCFFSMSFTYLIYFNTNQLLLQLFTYLVFFVTIATNIY